MLPDNEVDNIAYSRFIYKKSRTAALVWTELIFAFVLALVGTFEVLAYQETVCGLLLLTGAFVLFNLWLMFEYGSNYNSTVLLKAHTMVAVILALFVFFFTATSMLYLEAAEVTRESFRNTARLIWASMLCFVVVLAVFAVGSHSRTKEIDLLETARQEFFKKLVLTAQWYFDSVPNFPEDLSKTE